MSARPSANVTTTLTDNHSGELEALPHALPVHLVWKIGEANISVELFADDGGRARFRRLRERRTRGVHPAVAIGSEGVAVGG